MEMASNHNFTAEFPKCNSDPSRGAVTISSNPTSEEIAQLSQVLTYGAFTLALFLNKCEQEDRKFENQLEIAKAMNKGAPWVSRAIATLREAGLLVEQSLELNRSNKR